MSAFQVVAVPIGVVIGGIITGVAGYFGARAAGRFSVAAQAEAAKHARKLAFDEFIYQRRVALYEDLAAQVVEARYVDEYESAKRIEAHALNMRDNLGRMTVTDDAGVALKFRQYREALKMMRDAITERDRVMSTKVSPVDKADALDYFQRAKGFCHEAAFAFLDEMKIHVNSYNPKS